MKSSHKRWVRFLVVSLTVGSVIVAHAAPLSKPAADSSASPEVAKKAEIVTAYGKLPLSFIPNDGQVDKKVQFYEKSSDHATYFTKDGIWLSLTKGQASSSNAPSTLIKLIPQGANKNFTIVPEGLQEGKVNYFVGNDPKQWKTNIATYQAVVYQDVYPGINLKFYGTNRQMEYDIIVKPGADPSRVKLAYEGIEGLRVTDEGDLEVGLKGGTILQKKPVIYQEIDGKRVDVAGAFKVYPRRWGLAKRFAYGFEVTEYDQNRPLLIDPALIYSTFLGGGSVDGGDSIAVDSSGNAYVTGFTDSSDFPTASSLQAVYGGARDVFVAKLNAAGNGLIYSTYLGGSSIDEGWSIAVDGAGNAYVTGYTWSSNFPTMNPIQATRNGSEKDAFVAKLDPTGASLIYSTYLGGSGSDYGSGIVVDALGNAYVTGYTFSNNFPTANPYQAANGGSGVNSMDAFIAKLNTTGTALIYSTYLGGSGSDYGRGIAVDSSGNAYVTGETHSFNFPTASPIQGTDGDDAFVTKLDATGTALVYSTYLGGSKPDHAEGIAVDALGNAYVTGGTSSTNFPIVGAAQGTFGGNGDAFVSKVNAGGTALVYSTYLGGSDSDGVGGAIAVDTAGNVYVTGSTSSTDFPTANPVQGTLHGGQDLARGVVGKDAFVTELNATGSILFSTYLGGLYDDFGGAIAVDPAGNAYVTGRTRSVDFPTANPFQALSLYLDSTAFVAKMGPLPLNTLRVAKGGTGGGTVTSSPSGITCGPTCSSIFDPGTVVTLTATADATSTFVGWVGACTGLQDSCVVTVNEGKSAIAMLTSLTTGPLPDLVLTQVHTVSDLIAPAGSYLLVDTTVRNLGALPAANFTVTFHLSRNPIYGAGDDVVLTPSQQVTSLAAGLSDGGVWLDADVSGNLLIPVTTPPGTYYVCALVDSGSSIVETNEGNNTVCSSGGFSLVTVLPPGSVSDTWVASYHGPGNGTDTANAVAADAAGNVYVTGGSAGSGTIQDYATIKYDTSGNQLWVARYHGPGIGNDTARAVAVDVARNVYVTGESAGSGTDQDYATIKYDTDGNQLWVARYSEPGNRTDSATAVAVDADGNVYVTGWTTAPASDNSWVTIKYDTNGNQLWVAHYDKVLTAPAGLAVDVSGNVYITGTEPGYIGLLFAGAAYATVKYDANGNQLWVRGYNGSEPGTGVSGKNDDYAHGLAVDASGYVYVTGSSPFSNLSDYYPGRLDYATLKYDASEEGGRFDGRRLWASRYPPQIPFPGLNSNSNSEAGAVAVDTSGNVYVTGTIGANYDHPVPNIATIKYTPNGQQVWVANSSGSGSYGPLKGATVLALDPSGNVYVTAWGRAMKYDADGNQLWAVPNYLLGVDLEPLAMAVTHSGAMYLTGRSAANSGYTTVKYGGHLDLVMTQVSGPTSADVGQSITLTDTVTNQAAEGTQVGFTVAYYLSPTPVIAIADLYHSGSESHGVTRLAETRSVPPLGPNSSNTGSTTVTIPGVGDSNNPLGVAPGTYYIGAMADIRFSSLSGPSDTGELPEINEINNTLAGNTITIVAHPDLIMAAVIPNAGGVYPGATLSVTDTAKEQGYGATDASFTVAYHLSTNETYGDSDDVSITTTRTVASLAAGATNSATTILTIPATTPPGSYYVCAMADSANTNAETDEGNNALCSATRVTVSLTDLLMTAVTPNASSVNAGANLSITDSVKNQGIATTASFTVAYRLSLNTTYGDSDDVTMTTTRTVASLPAGATSSATTTLVIPATTLPGNYYVCVMADSANTGIETDEGNNTLCSATTVMVPFADVVLTALSTTTTSIASGAALSVSSTTMNQGGSSAGASITAFHLSSNTVYGDGDDVAFVVGQSVGSLGVGASSTASVSLTIPTTTSLGTYYICALADNGLVVSESNESNNTLCTATTIQVVTPSRDLVMTAVTPNAGSVNAGATLSVTNTVKNQGAVATSTSFTIAFRLSSNATYGDGDDIVLATTRTVSSLAAGASSSAATSVTIPTTTPPGSYSVCSMADATNTNTESDETNNALCSGAPIQVLGPDLVVTAITPAASTVNAGATVSVSNTANNQGGATAGSSVVAFHLSPNTTYGDGDDVVLTATRTIASLTAGGTSTSSTTVTIPSTTPAGSYYVCAKADANATVAENDETNNTLCSASPITVPFPDLLVTAISTTATTVNAGATVSVSNTVKNQGGTAAGSSVVAFHLSTNTTYGDGDDVFASTTRTITSLGIGAMSATTTTVTIPSTTVAGTYYLCAKADDTNTVSEGDELNNSLCTTTTLTVPLPDLIVSALSTTATTLSAGGTVSLSNTIKNQGGMPAGSSVVAFHLSTNPTYGDGDDVVITTTRTITSLAVGATSVATTTVTIPTTTLAGTYYLCAAADTTATVVEGDETNNSLCTATPVSLPGPDLTVSAVSTTATTVTPGATVSVSNSVSNTGGTPAGSSVVAFHLSADATYGDGDDLILTATRTITSVTAGATSTASTTVTIPVTTPAGTYYVCAAADATTTVTEGDETNNTRCTTTTVSNTLQFPDLTVSTLSTTATTITPGGTMSVTNAVSNPGASPASSVGVAFHLSTNPTYGDGDDLTSTTTRTIASINTGATDSATTTVSVPSPLAPGTYYLCAKADDAATVPESDETNNTRCTATTVTVAGPDLTVSALSTTATTITPGTSIALSNSVTNTGAASASSSVVAFRLSPNVTYGDGDDVVITATRTISTLAAGATSTASTTVTIPTGTAPGAYYLCAMADANGTVAESSETNNTQCTTSPVTLPGPDLIVTTVSTTSTTVNAGTTVSVSNSVKNQGGTSAGSSTVAFHLSTNATYGDGDDVAMTTTRTIASLAAGAVSTASTTVTVPSTTPAGPYYVCALADASATVAEDTETNNSLCTTTTVTVPPPDLLVTVLSTTSTVVNAGATFSLSNTIKNQGGTSAGSSVVAFHLSPNATYGDGDDVTMTATRTITTLAIGASSVGTTTVTVPTSTPAGTYYVCATADANATIAEGDETNNSLCTTTTLTVPPSDLLVTVLSTTSTVVNAGATFSLSNTIKNQGGTVAGSSVVAFHLSTNTTYGDGDDVAMTTTRTITTLAIGASSVGTTTVTVPSTTPAGAYYVCATADANNTVPEGEETNNSLCTTTTLTVPFPDLLVTAVSTTSTTVAKGATFSLSNTIKNQGGTPAGSSVVAFRLSVNTTYGDGDDVSLTATRTVASLAIGTSSVGSTTLTVPATTPSGSYYVCAFADANATVAEGDEGNNSLCTATPLTVP